MFRGSALGDWQSFMGGVCDCTGARVCFYGLHGLAELQGAGMSGLSCAPSIIQRFGTRKDKTT